jgi:HAD superfamily hydrolase (TIGR01509 family)
LCGDHPNVQNGKPAPDMYIKAARQMNVLPQHCLAFEDVMNAMLSAKNDLV